MITPLKISRTTSEPCLLTFISLFIIVTTALIYWQIHRFDFVYFDDNEYVFQNIHVQNGITANNLIWALTTFHSGNWHPLTWLSHMIDCQMFGLWAGGHHLTNLFFHIFNALLLFFAFQKMTGLAWQSGFVSILFALHPLHVESVAWISERKDVLSTFFWMLALLSYNQYVRRPGLLTWSGVLLSFIFGLMSKPMVVTLPFVLLLMDFWPLNRFSLQKTEQKDRLSIFHLIAEKAALFALAAASIFITINAQKHGGSITDLSIVPFSLRISNALAAYAEYISKMLCPFNLTVLYPYQKSISWEKILLSIALLSSIFVIAIRNKKNRPYVIVGWLWYIGTLVPVIGLVQVGRQSMADRYTYIPSIGLFIIVSWGIPQLMMRWRHKILWIAATGTLTIFILASLSWNQTRHWNNSVSLFKNALKKTDDNYIAHNNLGLALYYQGQIEDAINHYRQALRIHPNYIEALNNLGLALYGQGRIDDAIIYLSKALQLNPEIPEIHMTLGLALYQKGRVDIAIHHFLQAIALNPNFTDGHLNAASAFYEQRKIDKAIYHYKKALEIKPDNVKAHCNLATALRVNGETDQAIEHYLQAIKLNPNIPETYNNLGVTLIFKGDISWAIACFQDALTINPKYQNAKNNLNKALLMQNQPD